MLAVSEPTSRPAAPPATSLIHSASPLKPDELLLVYNARDARSRELAEYYSTARDVPMDQLCPVRVKPDQEEISRESFELLIRGPVRTFLEGHEFGRRIRCLVLFYGLPIRVGPKVATLSDRRLGDQWRGQLHAGVTQFEQLVAGLESLGSATRPATQPEGNAASGDEQQHFARLVQRYQRACEAAWGRIGPRAGTAEGQQDYRRLVGGMESAEGVGGMLARARAGPQTPQAAGQLDKMIGQVQAAETQTAELMERELTDPVRESARPLIERNHGLIGYLGSLNHDLALTRVDETVASVDSELTLVWWDSYALYRWMPNLLSWNVRAEPNLFGQATPRQQRTPVLMSCRVDGPSIAVARRIIDESIAAEKTGLSGKVYLDARGLPGNEGHAAYDEDLRELAGLLRRNTRLDVHLDDREALFAPGDCPDAMLYCGWYSLRKYVGAFRFVPGAVGFHIASFEAITIKTPGERGWVRGLLNDGIDATLGPVAEPYLLAFPKPKQFFGLLLTGRCSLAECYAYTNDLNSWMMLLIGDPLYRPFEHNPHLKIEQAFPLDRIPPEFRVSPPTQTAAP